MIDLGIRQGVLFGLILAALAIAPAPPVRTTNPAL